MQLAGRLHQELSATEQLLVGKVGLDDLADLRELAEEGLLAPPRPVPPPFADSDGLAAWLAGAGLVRLGRA